MNDDDDTRDLRARIDDRVRAVRAKDIDALLSSYAPDVVTCDLVAPLVNHGVAAVRARVADWFGSFATAIDYEIRDVVLAVAGDVAFDHHVTRVRGGGRAGEKIAT